MADLSAFIRLTESEVEGYLSSGHDYVSALANQINNHGPHREDSPFRARDLYRGPDEKSYREAFDKAVINHTWLARQRQMQAAQSD